MAVHNIMAAFDAFVWFIIAIKIVFVLSALGHLYLSHKGGHDKQDAKFAYWKERTEFVFIVSMAVLLIVTFNPRGKTFVLTRETSLLFFLFGWILLVTAQWGDFVQEAPWFKRIQAAMR